MLGATRIGWYGWGTATLAVVFLRLSGMDEGAALHDPLLYTLMVVFGAAFFIGNGLMILTGAIGALGCAVAWFSPGIPPINGIAAALLGYVVVDRLVDRRVPKSALGRDPPTTPCILSESRRLGQVDRAWVDIEDVAPVLPRALVAAEDANFCLHHGFDVAAIRAAIRAVIERGEVRGASTITQQVVKNVFLWRGRSWIRKALEAGLTPLVEALWPKRRILEVYMNVAETGEGVFGVAAAARRLGTGAADLSPVQAARLAVVLPSPKRRDPAALSPRLRRLAERVREGATTIRADGRSDCFEG